MIGTLNTSRNFHKTTRYIRRAGAQQVYANFCAAVTNDADRIADVMQTTAQQSTRVEKPCYHIAISPSADDSLSQQHWYQFTEDFLRAMGLTNRQAVGWLHHDATFPDGQARPHLHLVINRVGAMGQTYSTSWDYRRVDSVLRDLEAKYQLEAVPPARTAEVKRDSPGQVHRFKTEQAQYHDAHHPRSTPPQPSVRRQLQASIDQAISSAASPEGIADLLSRQGIETRMTQQGWSFSKDQIHLAGNQLGRRYSLNSVQQMVDQQSQQTDSAPSPQDRQRQRRLTMQDMMRESAEAQDGSAQREQSARQLNAMGQRMMRDSEDVDGLTMIGGAIAAVGTAVELGEAFSQKLEQARAKAQGKRATEQIKQLEGIGQRTTALEQSLMEQAHSGQSNHQTNVEPEPPEAIPSPDAIQSPVADSLHLAHDRLTAIGEQLGIELDDVEPIELDPTASTDQQLDQMDEAIAQLDQRLGNLEEAVATLTQTPEKQGAEIAQSLEQFTQARMQFRGETEPSAFSSSAGVVALTYEGFQGQDARITITDDDYGTVFESAKPAEGEWDTQINELQPEQIDIITQLPQSVEDYGQYKQGQQMVSALQTLTRQEFEGDRGQIDWRSKGSGFRYRFDIERQDDGTQRITGRDANRKTPVLNATISHDNDIFITQNDIPNSHSQELFQRREQALTPEPIQDNASQTIMLGAQPRTSRTKELEL